MRRFAPAVILVALLVTPAALFAGQLSQSTPFTTMEEHYEAIRQALLHDSTEGVATHARAIAQQAADLAAQFDAARADVPPDKSSACTALLPELEKAARSLEVAPDLESARAAFGELSKPMVRYREMTSGKRPMVVYCPMAKKSWLQPEGEIGNPYYGQKMARCGEVISK